MAFYVPELNRRPHLFLSHSSKDKEFVRQLANDLRACEIDVWLDEWEIAPGDSIYNAINNGIEFSKYVALIISEHFLASKWTSEEVEAAFHKQMEQESKVIIPILREKVQLPSLLKGKLSIPFIDSSEYYRSLTLLVGILHNLSLQSILDARLQIDPYSLKDVIRCLDYCGINTYTIIPKDVFDEISKTGKVEVNENRLRFYNLHFLLEDDELSERSKNHIRRIIEKYGDKWHDG